MKKHLYPMPEAVDGKKWTLKPGQPRVDTVDRVMWVPTDDSPASAFLRAHETAHARITPHKAADKLCKKHGVSMLAAQAVEDMRVHSFLRERDIDSTPTVDPDGDDVRKVVERIKDDARMLASALVSTHGTADHDTLYEAVSELPHGEDLLYAVHALSEAFELQENEVRCKWRRTRGRMRNKSPLAEPKGFEELTVPIAKMFDRLFPDSGPPDGETRLRGKYGRPRIAERDGNWGTVREITRAPMAMPRRPRSGGGKSWRDEGSCVKAPYRMILDGRIFCRKKRHKGGTVLVDCSGSMHLSEDDLYRIVSEAPGATVAGYCGSGSTGRIVIVADRGRMATNKTMATELAEGGNIVDGPALKWLASRPGPRVWVSDGMVTGIGDQMAGNLYEESVAICRSASIKRIPNADAVIEALG